MAGQSESSQARERDDPGIIRFLLLTFGISWTIWWTIVLADRVEWVAASTLDPVKDLAAFGPSLVALGITARKYGRSGVRDLLLQATRWRIGVQWYLLALAGPLIISLAALAIHQILGGDAQWPDATGLLAFPLVLVIVLLLFGPLGEEFGWRGYVLPRLQNRLGALNTGLILGVIWGIWHLPLFFMANAPQAETPLVPYLTLAIAQSILYVWIYNSTHGSLLTILLIHAAGNSWVGLAGILPESANSDGPFLLLTALTWMVALIVIVLTNPRTLTRSGLSGRDRRVARKKDPAPYTR